MELALDGLGRGVRARLRVPRSEDVEALTAICQDPDIRRFTKVPDPYTADDGQRYVDAAIEGWRAGGPAPWIVEVDGEVGGSVALVHVDREDGWSEFGYWTAPAMRRLGITTAAVRRVSDWAFDELGLVRLELQTATGNVGSELVARRAGFAWEGVRRSAAVLRAVDDLPACRTDLTVWVRLNPAADPPTGDQRLHHVQLAMPRGCEDRARAFYAGVLGFTEVAKPAALAARGGVWFRAGALEVHLGVEEPFQPARKAHPGILVSNLDEVASRLTTAGVTVRPDSALPGFRRFYVDDCFGNRLEFLQPDDGAPPQP